MTDKEAAAFEAEMFRRGKSLCGNDKTGSPTTVRTGDTGIIAPLPFASERRRKIKPSVGYSGRSCQRQKVTAATNKERNKKAAMVTTFSSSKHSANDPQSPGDPAHRPASQN